MSKKSWTILCNNLQNEMGQDFLQIQYCHWYNFRPQFVQKKPIGGQKSLLGYHMKTFWRHCAPDAYDRRRTLACQTSWRRGRTRSPRSPGPCAACARAAAHSSRWWTSCRRSGTPGTPCWSRWGPLKWIRRKVSWDKLTLIWETMFHNLEKIKNMPKKYFPLFTVYTILTI